MKSLTWLIGRSSLAGLLILMTSCGQSEQAATPESSNPTEATAQQALNSPKPQAFDKPTVMSAGVPGKSIKLSDIPLATVPVKGLIQSTPSSSRVAQVNVNGLRDPFASLVPSTPTMPIVPSTQASVSIVKPNSVAPLQPRTSVTPKPVTKLPTRVAFKPANFLPAPPISALPLLPPPSLVPGMSPIALPSPTNLAEAVEITGVVQLGNKIVAIAKAPGESSARYLEAGSYLSGGQILLKEIRLNQGGTPSVILKQNGREIVKSLG